LEDQDVGRWEDGIRMELREIGLGGVDWVRLAQDRDCWGAVVSAGVDWVRLAQDRDWWQAVVSAGVDWVRLAQDRDWWRAVVSAVMNLRFLVQRS
jgi:hypothetical protein